MSAHWPQLVRAEDRSAAEEWATGLLADALAMALAAHGKASLFCSGGSSPRGVYARLGDRALDWRNVSASLADERWVAPDDTASNARLVEETLLRGQASAARFVGMKTLDETPAQAVADRDKAISSLVGPHGVAIVGMGPDMHTLSWFPHAEGLDAAIDPDNRCVVAAVTAMRSAVTGEHLRRMTLTASAVARLSSVILLMFGEDKRAAFAAARTLSPHDAPIRHLVDVAGNKLTAIWAA